MCNKKENVLKWTLNNIVKSDDKQVQNMSLEEMTKASNFHKSFPQYSVTPLTRLQNLADYLGLKRLYVKDESYRFGLNAFKVLGGSYAIARYIAQQLGKDVSEVPYSVLTSDKLREEFGQATFFTATDGNHGRGIAWAANRLKQKCVVRMPKGTTQTRLENIAKENATVTIEDLNYDECVRLAAKEQRLLSTESWYRIPHGRDMKKFRPGSCRDMEHSQWKHLSSLKKTVLAQHIFSSRQVLVHLRVL